MPRRTRVLVVEDDDDLRHLFRTTLALAGFDVAEARTGLEALERIDHNPPDSWCSTSASRRSVVREQIAVHAHTRHVPVVVVTGSVANLDALDVNCVLRKPVSPAQIVSTVKSCLASGSPGMGA